MLFNLIIKMNLEKIKTGEKTEIRNIKMEKNEFRTKIKRNLRKNKTDFIGP